MSVRRSILVVDDDPQLLRLLARLLERAGHAVRTAASAAEALACLERAADVPPPDFELAILDVQLASGGGAEALLPELRARRPGLAFIVISGDALPPALERMLAAQGGRFLRKPFAPTALLALVDAPHGGASEGGGPARVAGAGCQVSSSVAAGSECQVASSVVAGSEC